MKNLTQKDWYENLNKLDDAVILDVRTSYEFDDGKIPNALNIDIMNPHEFMTKVKELDKTLPYFVYCKAGVRSAQACELMQQLGFENTNNLVGGFSEWEGPTEN